MCVYECVCVCACAWNLTWRLAVWYKLLLCVRACFESYVKVSILLPGSVIVLYMCVFACVSLTS